jgi:hypothetical protein
VSYLDEVLFDHVVEGGRNAVHGNSGVAHAQDTVELGSHEGHPGLGHRLSEYLVLDVFACLLERKSNNYFVAQRPFQDILNCLASFLPNFPSKRKVSL